MNLHEQLEEIRPHDGQTWGKWKLNTGLYTLTHADFEFEIRLDEISSCAEMLDWIFQLRAKTWITNEDMGDLTQAFDDIFQPQATMCSGGREKTFDARIHLDKWFGHKI